MDKVMKAQMRKEAERRAAAREGLIVVPARQEFPCAAGCSTPLTVLDNLNNALVSINVNGHAKAAHRQCPPPPPTDHSEVPAAPL